MPLFDLGYPGHDFESSRPRYRGTSLQEFYAAFPTEHHFFDHVFNVRYGSEYKCPKCGKRGKWYKRRGFNSLQHHCRHAISPMAHTLFHATKMPLSLWFYALLHFANSNEGRNPAFLSRHLGIGPLAAFKMARRIRLHLAAIDEHKRIGAKNGRVFVRLEQSRLVRNVGPNRPKSTTLFLLADEQSIDSTIVEYPTRHGLRKIILDKTRNAPEILTTCYHTYRVLSRYGIRKPIAQFVPTYFIDHENELDNAQAFLVSFRRQFEVQHKRADKRHFWQYIKESEFRFNRRRMSKRTFGDMIGSFPLLRAEDIARITKFHSRITEEGS